MKKIIEHVLTFVRTLFYLTRNEFIIDQAIRNAVSLDLIKMVNNEGKHQLKLERATIRVGDISTLRFVLIELSKRKNFDFLTKTKIAGILNHENAHANMAEIVGTTPTGYEVVIVKEYKNFYVAPFVSLEHPDDWLNKRENILAMIRILNAPNEYGDSNSVSDNKRIAELQETLLTIH